MEFIYKNDSEEVKIVEDTLLHLWVSTGWDDFEADVSEGVEDDYRVGGDVDPVRGLLGGAAGGVRAPPPRLELALQQ